MAQPLLSLSEVMALTWHEGKTHLKDDLKISAGFVGIALLSFVIALVSFYIPNGLRLALFVLDILLLQILGTSALSLKLVSQVISERQKSRLQPFTLKLFGSFLFISLLNGLAVAGGTLAFVLPGIWLSIAFLFANYLLVDQGKTGRQALAASAALVKDRWWSVFVRLVLPGALILIIGMVASSIIEGLVGLIAGYQPSNLIALTGFTNWPVLNPPAIQVASAALEVINAVPYIICLPFLFHLVTTIYLDLKRTR